MKRNIKKVSKIVNELTMFLLEHQSTNIKVGVRNFDDKVVITAVAEDIEKMDIAVTNLKKSLSYPRTREIEEYCWELTGESETESGLAIVGSMVDEATIDYDETQLYVQLTRLIKK
ncbi:MAG: hypothetical protein ATN35_00195 [Epulopiscium sp. Nele67-Bin004]|nr:MAG: hypothetical protein ATN35_00195 [Epulopiscium sp. Nele67-Bin004]